VRPFDLLIPSLLQRRRDTRSASPGPHRPVRAGPLAGEQIALLGLHAHQPHESLFGLSMLLEPAIGQDVPDPKRVSRRCRQIRIVRWQSRGSFSNTSEP